VQDERERRGRLFRSSLHGEAGTAVQHYPRAHTSLCWSGKKTRHMLLQKNRLMLPPPPPKFSPYRPKLQGWHVCSHITITPTFIPLYWRHNSLATRRAASGADEIGWLGALWLVLLFSRPNSHIQTQLTWSWCATTITTSGCTSDCYVCYIQHIFI
jgi:hypothetical protein